MRRFVAFAMAAAVGLSVFEPAAFAKKPKEGTEGAAPAEEAVLEMKTIGIPDVDAVFAAAAAPIQTIRDSRMKVDSMNATLAQVLGLASGSGVDAIAADLQAKGPGGVSDEAKATITGMKADIEGLIQNLSGLPQQFADVAAKAQGIDPSSFATAGLKPTDLMKAPKSLANNIKVLGSAPNEVQALLGSLNNLKNAMVAVVP